MFVHILLCCSVQQRPYNREIPHLRSCSVCLNMVQNNNTIRELESSIRIVTLTKATLYTVYCSIWIFIFRSNIAPRLPPNILQEESSISRRSQMDLLNSQPSVLRSSCEIPLNRAPTPSHSELHYTSHRALPHVLYKSMSSNNIPPPPAPFYSGRGTPQQMRPWRYPSSSTTRPVGLPYSISQQSLSCRAGCHCQCDSSRKQVSDFHSLFRKQVSCFTFFIYSKTGEFHCFFV
jgi:hypothetical protein